MVFPTETEATVRRRILQICQEYARLIVDIVRELFQIIDEASMDEMDKARIHNGNLYSLLEESREVKLKLFDEITSVGTLLINREAFLRLIFELERITDNAEATAYRLMYIIDGKIKAGRRYLKDLASFSAKVLDETARVRDIIMALMFNPEKALELSSVVENHEKEVDVAHRELDLKLLTSERNVSALLLLRDIVERIETISDIGVDVVELVRMLTIYG
ncbi:MAG: DUF47 family protein [Candidatus Bathyarchaeia archaeon]|nr:DUF47 family protein [Candidatus Bathyarchaeota archaeon]